MKILFKLLILVLVGLGLWFLFINNSPVVTVTNNKAESQVEKINTNKWSEYPISLPALMDENFDGRDLQLGKILDDNSAYTRYYITYKSGSLTISGIMNVPKSEGQFPLLVLNHGHIDPEIYTNGRGLKREQDYLARRGYVVLHPDYRNHADSSKDLGTDINFRLGYTEDVINAVLAAQNSDLDFINKDQVGMLGHSMGGGVTQNVLVVKPDLVKAVVLFAPVSGDQRLNYERWIARRSEAIEQIEKIYGEYTEDMNFWDGISANTFYDKITAPILIHHGTADDSVPLEWSEEMQGELEEVGVDATLYIYDGEPHEFIVAWPQVMQRTVDFFDKYLKST